MSEPCKCLFCGARWSVVTDGERCRQRDVDLGDGRTIHSHHVFAHSWERTSTEWTSGRTCTTCGEQQWFIEAEL